MPILQSTKLKKHSRKVKYFNIAVSKTQIYKYYAITLKCTLNLKNGYYYEAHF